MSACCAHPLPVQLRHTLAVRLRLGLKKLEGRPKWMAFTTLPRSLRRGSPLVFNVQVILSDYSTVRTVASNCNQCGPFRTRVLSDIVADSTRRLHVCVRAVGFTRCKLRTSRARSNSKSNRRQLYYRNVHRSPDGMIGLLVSPGGHAQ